MANQIVTRDVTAICGESHRDGTLKIREFSRNQRMRRAWKTFGVCLVVLVACACVPGAHLILVPLMALLTPWFVRRTWKTPSAIEAIEVACAQCQGELTRLSSRECYPIFENCTVCRRENRIILKTDACATSSTSP